MPVDNNCITLTGVTISTGDVGQGAVVNQIVDFDIKLTQTQGQPNQWTLSINPKLSGGKPNTAKVHYTFVQSDMAQILNAMNNIWANQPAS